ncbi:MAG: fatty acid desaturase, partial [Bacteroidales bacterium]|nr:fatty acid desaturase [Bacteroidales bacterium]
MQTTTSTETSKSWHSIISKYNKPRMSRSVWQIINSVGSYILIWVAIIYSINISYWITIPLMIIASGLLTRIFIIFHDCGHGSFFKNKKLNVMVGKACGILVFTPYHKWTDSHQNHHQTVGNLDKRGDGDVWTMTVEEFQNSKPSKQFSYKFFRHPLFLILLGGPLLFLIYQRFTRRTMTSKQKKNIYFTNIVLLIIAS